MKIRLCTFLFTLYNRVNDIIIGLEFPFEQVFPYENDSWTFKAFTAIERFQIRQNLYDKYHFCFWCHLHKVNSFYKY